MQGKGAGLREAVAKLEHDPCATAAYKLVGPLRDRVCGLHMRRDYRLAFSFVADAKDEQGKGREVVAVLAIGAKTSGPGGRPPPRSSSFTRSSANRSARDTEARALLRAGSSADQPSGAR